MRLVRYLLSYRIHEKLPRLQRSFKDTFIPTDLTEDEYLVLISGIVRDPHAARALLAKHRAASAPELLNLLTDRKPRRRIAARLKRWIQQIEGSSSTDPHRDDLCDGSNNL